MPWILMFAGVLLACTTGRIQAASFTASLDRDTITLGEQATLSLTIEGGDSDTPTPPEVPNLQISYLGPSRQVSIVNGAVNSTTTYNFIVAPRVIGEFVIPPIIVKVNGQTLRSSALKLHAVKPGASVASGSGDALAMLKLVIPKNRAFVGEVIPARLQLYLHSSIQNFGNFQITSFPAEGLTVGKMAEAQKNRVQIGNSIYTEINIAAALTPIKSGTFSIGPVAARLVVEMPSPDRRRDPFDPFSMFNRNEQKQVTLATDPVTVDLLSLPQNAPADFSGAVGNYSLSMTAGPTNVAVGDPITLRITISGRGALDAIGLPNLAGWRDFKLYPPTSTIETTDQLGIEGKKTFEQVVAPQNTDVRTLPPFSFSYFDPELKSYRTLKQPAIPLTVRPGGSLPAPSVAATRNSGDNAPQRSQDIVPIKQRLGTTSKLAPALIRQPWFLSLQSVPLLALLGAVAWRKRTEALANNPRLRRQRRVAQLVREGLNELRGSAAANDSDAFFATVFRLLQEQLGERLDVPASSITEAVIDERLRPKGVPEDALNALHDLFQICNLARYAPIKSSQELAAIIPKVESTLNQLREVKL